ncbi:signal transducer and activator of transcription 1-alpha/beta-like isoform X1 [Lampetra fluviatilis]
MAQWNKLQQLDMKYLELLDQLYNESFPMEVRQFIAPWIEGQDWSHAASDPSQASLLLHTLLSQLDVQYGRFSSEHNLLLQHNLRKIKQNIQAKYLENPTQMASLISQCLQEEQHILDRANKAHMGAEGQQYRPQSSIQSEKQKNLELTIAEVKKRVQVTEQNIKSLENCQDEFDFRYKDFQTKDGPESNSASLLSKQQPSPQNGKPNGQGDSIKQMARLQVMLQNLDQNRKQILQSMTELLAIADYVHKKPLLEELNEWKRRQQLGCIGGPPNICLDHLEKWYTELAEALLQVLRQLRKLEELQQKVTYKGDPIVSYKGDLEEKTSNLLQALFNNAFVVECQPCMPTHPQRPLVIKTSVQFTAKIRLLVKLSELNYQLKVKASIDKDIGDKPPVKGFRRFNILGTNTKVMNMEECNSGSLAVEFRHLQVREQRTQAGGRNEGSLIVTEELHLISFETQFYHQSLKMDLETTSLPVIVISNVSQLPNGWASILWYNMLTNEQKNLSLFLNPPAASWSLLSDVLSWQFSCVTSRGLNPQQLVTLAEKLLGLTTNYKECQVPWAKFCKENMPEKQFSFWLWLDGIIELIKKHLLPIWNEGYIMGFVSKDTEKSLLKDQLSGTFLLRFSESSRDGGITFTWVEKQDGIACGDVQIHSVEPYTKQQLTAVSFPDIINSFKILSDANIPECPLKFLYPNIGKDQAFSKYYSRKVDAMEEDKKEGYIQTVFIPVHEFRRVPRNSDIFPMSPEDFQQLTDTFPDFDQISMELCSPPHPPL